MCYKVFKHAKVKLIQLSFCATQYIFRSRLLVTSTTSALWSRNAHYIHGDMLFMSFLCVVVVPYPTMSGWFKSIDCKQRTLLSFLLQLMHYSLKNTCLLFKK